MQTFKPGDKVGTPSGKSVVSGVLRQPDEYGRSVLVACDGSWCLFEPGLLTLIAPAPRTPEEIAWEAVYSDLTEPVIGDWEPFADDPADWSEADWENASLSHALCLFAIEEANNA